MYYDGVEVKSQNDAFGDFGTIPAYLGTFNANERFYQGLIDEVCIWSRTLSAEEIATLGCGIVNMADFQIIQAKINFGETDEDRINVKGTAILMATHDGQLVADPRRNIIKIENGKTN